MNLFECRGLAMEYRMGETSTRALNGVDLDIPQGQFTVISGPSGSGKSTLLNILGLMEPVQTGSVTLSGQSYTQMSERERSALRRFKFGFIFQTFNLIDVLSAEENVEYFLSSQGVSSAERRMRVEESLRDVGLWEHRMKRPLQMSGGQRQRVAIARAMAKRPEVLVADEPTASLDQENGRQVMALLHRMNESRGVTILVASHDPMVLGQAKHVVRLEDGRIA